MLQASVIKPRYKAPFAPGKSTALPRAACVAFKEITRITVGSAKELAATIFLREARYAVTSAPIAGEDHRIANAVMEYSPACRKINHSKCAALMMATPIIQAL